MSGSRPAHLYHEARRLEQGLGVTAEGGTELLTGQRPGQGLEDLLLSRAKEFRQYPVDDDPGQAHGRLGVQALDQFDGLADRHLLGSRHGQYSRGLLVGEDIEHPVGLLAYEPNLDQAVDGLGSGQLADYVAAGHGIYDHYVVMAFADFPAQLADGDDLADTRRGRSDEIEHLGQRPDVRRPPEPQLQGQVLAQRCLGVHGHHPEVGRYFTFFEPRRRRFPASPRGPAR